MLSSLERQIIFYSKAYYEGKSIISDQEFDALEESLRKENPNSEILKSIGYGYSPRNSDLVTKPHRLKNLHGLLKIFVDPEDKLGKGYYTPKYDGASVTLYYKEGKLELALTRGDGSEGSDVTDKLRYIVPTSISKDIEVVSGEWIISKSNFSEFYPDSIAPRNTAVGFLMRKSYDLSELLNFDFVAYRIEKFKTSIKETSLSIRSILANNGFKVDFIIQDFGNSSYIELKNHLSSVNYNLDGIVYESGVFIDPEGVVSYLDEKAYKNNSEIRKSVVTKIDWNFTRTGKLVPVVNYEEIELSGAKCSRASAFNAQYIKDNRIGKGSVIEVTRSGEIIPYIVSSTPSNEVDLPQSCPYCGSLLEFDGIDLACTNDRRCSQILYNRLYNYIEVVAASKVKGASNIVISSLIEFNRWKTPTEIHRSSELFLPMERIGPSSYQLAREVYEILKSPINPIEMLVGLSIPKIGYRVSEVVIDRIKDLIRTQSNKWEFQDLPGIGESIEYSLITYKDLIIDTWNSIESTSGFLEENPEDTSSLIKVCITGALPSKMKKSEFFEKYKDLIQESNVKDSDYVISNKMDSSKTKEALKLDKPIYSESDFLSKIKPLINSKEE